MNKRVSLFLPSLRGGGAERVMINLAKGFSEHGLYVDLVLAKATGPYLSQVPQSVRVIDLKSRRVAYSLFPLMKYLRMERPRALISALNHANIIAILAREISRVETWLIVTEHSTLSISQQNAMNKRSNCIPLLMKYFYPFANEVVAVSKGVAEDLSGHVGFSLDRIKVIYNPIIDEQLIQKSWEKADHPWFQDSRIPIVLSAGRLTEAKDFPTLIRAFAKVREKMLAKLVILGEGEKRIELEQMVDSLGVKEDVWMPGFVDNPYPYMRRADVFVLSSKWEGFGNVIVEALACGCPVIATDCPSGPREILKDGNYGILVPVGDVNVLSEKIMEILHPENHLNNKEIGGIQQYTLETIVNQYLSLIFNV